MTGARVSGDSVEFEGRRALLRAVEAEVAIRIRRPSPTVCSIESGAKLGQCPTQSVRHEMPPPTYQSDSGCLPTGLKSAAEGVSHLGTLSEQHLGGRSRTHHERFHRDRGSGMAQDVEHLAGRVANKEAADAPRLVGQGMHDLAPQALSRSVRRVDIVDLNRRIWHH